MSGKPRASQPVRGGPSQRASPTAPRGPAPARPSRPPAALLHASGSQFSWGAVPGTIATRLPFHPNPAVSLAELAAWVQAVLAAVTGVSLIRGTLLVSQLHTGVNLTLTRDITTHFGVGILVLAVLLIVLASAVAVPSQWARALLAVVEAFGLGVTLAAHFGGGSVLGFVTVLTMGVGGSALIPFGAVIGIEAGVVYVLAIHPPTYRAFSR